jgi:protease I
VPDYLRRFVAARLATLEPPASRQLPEGPELAPREGMAKIAMLLADDFEDSEFRIPFDRLTENGHRVEVLGSERKTVKGKKGDEEVRLDGRVSDHAPDDYDALVIPGGYSPDHLRMDPSVVDFVKLFSRSGKPVAAVCHGPQLLVEADVVKGYTLTSWPSVRTDLENAGARWVDEEVVVDEPFITSRKPQDLEAFSTTLLTRLAQSAS